MPVPKKRVSRTRRDKRRTHDALPPINPIKCPQCEQFMMPHHICPGCGFYKGKQVIDTGA